MIRLLTAPARAGGKAYVEVVTASVGAVARCFTRIIGGELLSDLSAFVTALESMFGGFRERAQHTYELLKAPGTAFVVVAAPEPDALREASYFVDRLSAEHMPLAGLVVNRDAPSGAGQGCRAAAARRGPRRPPTRWPARPRTTATELAEAALRVHAEVGRRRPSTTRG